MVIACHNFHALMVHVVLHVSASAVLLAQLPSSSVAFATVLCNFQPYFTSMAAIFIKGFAISPKRHPGEHLSWSLAGEFLQIK